MLGMCAFGIVWLTQDLRRHCAQARCSTICRRRLERAGRPILQEPIPPAQHAVQCTDVFEVADFTCCAGTACKPYAALFAEDAWRELAYLFRKDLYRMHSMPLESQLSIHLQVSFSRTRLYLW